MLISCTWCVYIMCVCPDNICICFPPQVLSGTVSKALSLTGGDDASETAYFIKMMDQFFLIA